MAEIITTVLYYVVCIVGVWRCVWTVGVFMRDHFDA